MNRRVLSIVTVLVGALFLLQCVAVTPSTQAPPPGNARQEVHAGRFRLARSQELDNLLAPLDEDIRTYFRSFTSPEDLLHADTGELSAKLLRKHRKNLEAVVRLIEESEGATLSPAEREVIMREIVESEITRISNEVLAKMLGTPEVTFEATVVPVSPPPGQ